MVKYIFFSIIYKKALNHLKIKILSINFIKLNKIIILFFKTKIILIIGIMDHEEAKKRKTGGKILGFFY